MPETCLRLQLTYVKLLEVSFRELSNNTLYLAIVCNVYTLYGKVHSCSKGKMQLKSKCIQEALFALYASICIYIFFQVLV